MFSITLIHFLPLWRLSTFIRVDNRAFPGIFSFSGSVIGKEENAGVAVFRKPKTRAPDWSLPLIIHFHNPLKEQRPASAYWSTSGSFLILSALGGESRHDNRIFSQFYKIWGRMQPLPVGGISKSKSKNHISGMYNLLSQ